MATGVNAIKRAYTISTKQEEWLDHYLPECVNALQRAYSISTMSLSVGSFLNKNVSMPFNGLRPFLPLPFWKPLFIRVWKVHFPQDFLNCYIL